MKTIYEYLISDINQDPDFNYDDRFWIEAVTNVTIDGNFEISTDANNWIEIHDKYNMSAGDQIYLYTKNKPEQLKYTGKFNIGGNINGLISKDCSNIANKTFSSAFRGSEVIDASNLDLSKVKLIMEEFSYMFKDCKSLVAAPELPATKLEPYCYNYMFMGCINLITTPKILPATKLEPYCYNYMFYNCKSITQAPKLPATILSFCCYTGMFYKCKSLKTAPSLPATKLAERCYNYMFCYCISLKQTPSLPATKLAERCYSDMFSNCTSLVQTSTLPATTLAPGCYDSMFYNCSALSIKPNIAADINNSNCKSMFKNTKIKI